MSNPSINRWGLNTYWNSLWYSDVRYSTNLKQDAIFEELLQTYLHYGLKMRSSYFVHPFWHKITNEKYKLKVKKQDQKYYKAFTKWDFVTRDYIFYSLRTRQLDLYFMKIWILKFNNWVIINLYWFQPLKRKGKYYYRSKNYFFIKFNKVRQFSLWKRMYATISKTYFRHWTLKSKYLF